MFLTANGTGTAGIRSCRLRARIAAATLVALSFAGIDAHAAEPDCSGDLSADRPGLSTDTAVLARGCQQVEAGAQYSHDDTGLRTTTFPLALYRLGINGAFELRASWDGENSMRRQGENDHSASDSSIGAKIRLHDSDRLSMSLLGELTLPTGSAAATSGASDPSLALLWKTTLSPSTSLSGALTRVRISNPDAGAHWQSQIAIDLGRDLDNGFGAFIEYVDNRQQGDQDEQTVDGGATWRVGRDLQLDVNGGRSWQGTRQDFVGFGLAWRY